MWNDVKVIPVLTVFTSVASCLLPKKPQPPIKSRQATSELDLLEIWRCETWRSRERHDAILHDACGRGRCERWGYKFYGYIRERRQAENEKEETQFRM
jgi:hypothetical protein